MSAEDDFLLCYAGEERRNILGNKFMGGVVEVSLSQGLIRMSPPSKKNRLFSIGDSFSLKKKKTHTACFLKTKEIINNGNSQFYSDYLPRVLLVHVVLFH